MSLEAPSDATTRTTVDEVYNTEYISRFWREGPVDPIIGQELVKLVPLPLEEANSLVYEVPIVGEMTGVAAVSGTNAAPEDSLETTMAQITCALYGLRTFVKDNTKSKVMRVGEVAMHKLQLAHQDYVHRQILALMTSIGSSAGTNATENTLANWDAQTQAHRTLLYTPGPMFGVLNPDAVRDMRGDLSSNMSALFGSGWGEKAADALKATQAGLMRTFDGYFIHESANTPAGDTTGWTNALLVGGEDAWAELVVMQDLESEFQRDASRYGTWMVGGMIVGWGIVKQSQARAFVSRT
jgi:hypothetical protein